MRLDPKKLIGTVAVATAAGALLFAGPASAAVDYTVSPGGAVTATNSGNLVFTDTTSSSKPKLTCTTLNAKGTANAGGHAFAAAPAAGSTTTPTDVAGSVTPVAGNISGCTNVTVGATNITPSGTWKLWLDSKTSTGGHGYIGGIVAHVAAASGTCQFDAQGYLAGTYVNSTGVLTADPAVSGLKISNVAGTACPLVGIANGHAANLTGGIKLTPIQTIS